MRSTFIIASFTATLISGVASACDRVHTLEYEKGEGIAAVTVNGVHYHKMTKPGASRVNFVAWVLPGENVVDVTYSGDGEAKVWLASGCNGEFKTEPVSGKVDLADGGTTRFSFSQNFFVDPVFHKTTPSDDAGLANAYEAFRKDVVARDLKAVIQWYDSFFDRAEEQGFPRDYLVERLTIAIETGELEVQETGRFKAVAGGRVYQHLSDDLTPKMLLRYPNDSGRTSTFNLGTYWTKVNGVWEIIYP
ncbi:MAG: hypothetical protein AAGF56_13020 [Pseudomonadota bacterium]